ncbi:phosphatase PAP2 family protein [Flavobacterium suzhouense]|uniref:Phosphatase PAP2 family protein n=1 Tax=Flavobacterium suzhouense TaxID=1529638 RepID=A0ABW5NSX2_9FLAO
MKKFLALFSYIFHPLFVPVYATLFYFVVANSFFYEHEIYLAFVQVLILTVLLPMSIFYLLRSLGKMKSKLPNAKERRLPLAIYALLILFLIKYSLSIVVIPELYYYFTGVLISTVITLALVLGNFSPSLHTMATASLVLFVIGISSYYHITYLYLIALLVVCTGIVGSSRMAARSHSLSEVLLGALIGIVPQVGLWFIWLVPAV